MRSTALALMIALAVAAPPAAADERRHDVYVDLLGKGGLWGVGYDYLFSHRFAVGAAASFYVLGGDRFTTFSPYLTAYPAISGSGHHRWFAQLGPQLVHKSTPSPVPTWQGMTTNGFGAELSTGYEYRDHLLVRVYAMASVGERFAPWFGVSLGWTL